MNKLDSIYDLLKNLQPYELKVEDNSASHANHYDQVKNSHFPSHISIFIVSSLFDELSLVERERLVNRALAPAYKKGLHASTIKTSTIELYKLLDNKT